MPAEDGTYSTSERSTYSDGPCPQCGGRTVTTWIPANSIDHRDDRWIPGSYRCANPDRHQ
ncbi:hypothetical protein ASG41_13515 [Modestobacter sp. Leaf380]|nr:hypothetical protein ASG41_13515 [Modestobacter sp. Leaf380]